MKKTAALVLILALLLAGATGAVCEAGATLEAMTVPMYVTTLENETEITLYCIDGQSDIPYIDMETAMHLLVMVQRYAGDEDYELTMETNGAVVYFTRENGSRVGIDFANGAIGWEDYNMFTAKSYAVNSLDILGSSGLDEDGEAYLFRRSTSSFVRRGQPVGLEFADFFIELAFEDGKGYMPLQTFSDLFLAYCYFNIAYNGEAVFLVYSSDLGDMREAYYSVEPKPRSEALARFNYVEMCLSLQFNYGLKDQHDIPSFGTLFELTGMQDRLQSADALEANVALSDAINGYIDDLHSSFRYASPYAGDVEVVPTVASVSTQRLIGHAQRLAQAMMDAMPTGMKFYQEVGNTAYVSFNTFEINDDVDYYQALAEGEQIADTIGVIMYAHAQITRENSPIENVVLDLSLNTGGALDAAVFTIAWFLGECNLQFTDAITGAQASMTYYADVNGDRVFDERDSIASLNRYCLISPVSFSCGNLVPAALKSSNMVTLLGRQSGGGTCAVQPLATADGSIWQISGRIQMSTVINGSLYDVDQGIAPDYVIDKVENYYNREALTQYINDLF